MNKTIKKQFVPTLDEEALDNILKTLIEELLNLLQQKNANKSFEQLHHYVYDLVLHQQGITLYIQFQNIMKEYLKSNILPTLHKKLNTNMLASLNKIWSNYEQVTQNMCEVLNYLDRVQLKHQNLLGIRKICAKLFGDLIILSEKVQDAVRQNLLRLVEADRRGVDIDRQLFKKIILILMTTGVDTRDIYESVFESAFLSTSAAYFECLAEEYMSLKDPCFFFDKIKYHYIDECQRVGYYLDPSTEDHIMKILSKHLIRKGLRALIDMKDTGAYCMLQNSSFGMLSLMYDIFSLFRQDGVQIVSEIVCEYIKKETIQQRYNKNSAASFIQILLNLKQQLDEILDRAFNSNEFLQKEMKLNFKQVLNSESKAAEYLSLHIHSTLVLCAQEQLEHSRAKSILSVLMTFHQYLSSKHAFELNYEAHFARRLLLFDVLAEELELYVIEHLRSETGSTYITNLDVMWQDIKSSKVLNQQFKQTDIQQAIDFEFSLNIITSNNWPTNKIITCCLLPLEATKAMEVFKEFYADNYAHKKLRLCTNLGFAQLRATFYAESGASRSYVLHVSTQQLCIIMLFNRYKHLTFDDILQKTGLCVKDLLCELRALTAGQDNQRLLIANGLDDNTIIVSNELVTLNWNFSAPAVAKNYLNANNMESSFIEPNTEQQTYLPDRRSLVGAIIVRIMKRYRVLTYDMLLANITREYNYEYLPSNAVMKIELDKLIEQEYLRKCEGTKSVYEYIP